MWGAPRSSISTARRGSGKTEGTMKPEHITETLEAAAEHLGIRVRYETMTGETAGGGGLCKVKGQWCVIMDRKTPPAERVALLVEALAGFDTEAIFLPPEV